MIQGIVKNLGERFASITKPIAAEPVAEKKKWYAGDKPTARETVARIYDITQGDDVGRKTLYEKFLKEQETPGSDFYNPYSKPTSYKTTQEVTKRTAKAETEWAAMQKELGYWAKVGLSDEEAVAKMDWENKYPTLRQMDEKRVQGDALALNKRVGYSQDAMYGILWAARNDGGTGNVMADAVLSAQGKGKRYQSNPVAESRRDPASTEYNPYLRATADPLLMELGVDRIDDEWLNANRDMLRTPQTAELWREAYELNQRTQTARDERDALMAWTDRMVNAGMSAEWIRENIELSDDYPTLREMDEGRYMGLPVYLGDAVDYRKEDVLAYAERQAAALRAKTEAASDPAALDAAVTDAKTQQQNSSGSLLNAGTDAGLIPPSVTNGGMDGETALEASTNWLGIPDPMNALPKDGSIPENIEQWQVPTPSSALPEGGRMFAGAGNSDVIYTDSVTTMREELQRLDSEIVSLEAASMPEGYPDPMGIFAKSRENISVLQQERAKTEEKLLNVVKDEDAKWNDRMNAAQALGAWDAAAKLQYDAIVKKLESVEGIDSAGGAQAAASTLCAYVVSGEDLKELDALDPEVKTQLEAYQGYCTQALGMYEDQELYNFLDGALGGALKGTKYNEGLGFLQTVGTALTMGVNKFNDVLGNVAGTLMNVYGYAVEGSEALWNSTVGALGGPKVGNFSSQIKQAGTDVANYYDQAIASIDQYLQENASTLEYFTAMAVSEGVKMAGEVVVGKGIGGAAASVADASKAVKTATEALKIEQLVHTISTMPFVAESGAATYQEVEQETGSVGKSIFSAFVSSLVTLSTAHIGVAGSMDINPAVNKLMTRLQRIQGANVMATAKRWGTAGLQFLGDLFTQSGGEGLQEGLEYVLTEPAVAAIKGDLTKVDGTKIAQFAQEATGNVIMGTLSAFGGTVQAMPSYARSVILAESMMGRGRMTLEDKLALVDAYQKDMADPVIAAETDKNLAQQALDVQTGMVLAQQAEQVRQQGEDLAKAQADLATAESQVDGAMMALDTALNNALANPTPDTAAIYSEAIKAVDEAQAKVRAAYDTYMSVRAAGEKMAADARAQAKAQIEAVEAAQVRGAIQNEVIASQTETVNPLAGDQASAVDAMQERGAQQNALPTTAPEAIIPGVPGSEQTTQADMPQRQFGSQTAQRSEALHPEVKQWLLDHSGYEADTNRAQIQRAIDRIESEGYESVLTDFLNADVEQLTTADSQALGVTLMGIAAQTGDVATEVLVADKYNQMGTGPAQSLQARKIFNRLTPLGAVAYTQKQVQRINDKLRQRGSQTLVELPEPDVQKITEAKTLGEREEAMKDALRSIYAQIPPTWADRLNAWRFLAMLGNPRTHIRNLLGNTVFMPIVGAKNKVGAGIEAVAQKAGWIDTRTKTGKLRVDAKYRAFAKQEAENMKSLLLGSGKYNEGSQERQNKRSFGNSLAGKALQKLVDLNSNALEAEDWLALSRHYRNALAGWLAANKIDTDNISEQKLDEARTYSIQEAQKATFRDLSTFVTALNRMGRKEDGSRSVLGYAIEGVLPFKSTPLNILKRGIEYSPVGLLSTIYKWGKQSVKLENAKKAAEARGEEFSEQDYQTMTANDFIDGLAAGLTGTTAMALGALLSSLGLIKGSLGDDAEDDFWELLGRQEYSVEIGGVSYTVDWVTPVSMPVLAGAAMFEYAEENGLTFDALTKGLMATAEPIFNLSMLDGINSMIESASYAEENGVVGIATTALTGLLGQFVPTLLGQIARATDPVRRTVTTDRESPIPKDFQYLVGKTQNKIPGLSVYSEPYINEWGETEENDHPLFVRFVEQMISPGYVSEVEVDETEAFLLELAKTAGDSVFPNTPRDTFKVNGVDYKMSPKEYTEYKTYVGQTKKALMDGLVKNEEFLALEPVYQAKAIERAEDYANVMGRYRINSGYKVTPAKYLTAYEKDNALGMVLDTAKEARIDDARTGGYEKLNEAVNNVDPEAIINSVAFLKETGLTDRNIKTKLSNTYKETYQKAWQSGDIVLCTQIEDALRFAGVGFKSFNDWRKIEEEE